MRSKQLIERYLPANLPDDTSGIIAFLYDELWRIANGMETYKAGLSVEEVAIDVPIGQPGAVYPLFIDSVPSIDVPGGGWDAPAGSWEAPTNGFYSVDLICQVQGLDEPGLQIYVVNLNLLVNGVIVYTASNSGNDSYPLSCAISYTGRLQRDDLVTATVQMDHSTKVGVVPAQFNLSMQLQGLEE